MTDLIIIGAGGFGRETQNFINRINMKEGPTWNFRGFIDDSATATKEGEIILGGLEDYFKMDKSIQYFIAIASMEVREKIAKRCKEAGYTAATLIGYDCVLAPGCEIGEGTYIGAGTTVKRKAKIGPFCVLQSGGVVGRGTEIGAFTSVMTTPCFGEHVKIGKYNYFGLRCNVADGVTTTDYCTFGASATVTQDATVPGTYAGVPAVLKKPLVK